MLGGARPSTSRFLPSLYDALQSRMEKFAKRDLMNVALALSHLSIPKPRKLVERLCEVVDHKMDVFSPLDMLQFLRSLVIPYTPLPRSFIQKGVKLTESGLHAFHAGQLLNYFRLSSIICRNPSGTLIPSCHCNQKAFVVEKLKERLSATFDEGLKKGILNPNQLSGFLMTCAHFDFKPEVAILASKRQFTANPTHFDVSSVTVLVHALCLLNEIDDTVMEALHRSRLTSVKIADLSTTERKHLCKLLIAMKILYDKVCLEEPSVALGDMIYLFSGSSRNCVKRGGRSVLCCSSVVNI